MKEANRRIPTARGDSAQETGEYLLLMSVILLLWLSPGNVSCSYRHTLPAFLMEAPMKIRRGLIAALSAAALLGSQAIAAPPADRNPDSPGLGWAYGRGVPGPTGGAGIAFVLLAGGYALYRRFRARKKTD
jgi:hypothetical protein